MFLSLQATGGNEVKGKVTIFLFGIDEFDIQRTVYRDMFL
jgi:hypothetical protein